MKKVIKIIRYYLKHIGSFFNSQIRSQRKILKNIGYLSLILVFCSGLFLLELTRIDQVGLHSNFHLCPALKFLDRIPKILDIFYFPLTFHKSALPQYRIEVNTKDLQKFSVKIPACFECNGPPVSDRVTAKFIAEGQEYEVQMGLRGLCSDHWMGDKKSWKIIFPDNHLFRGIKRLNLILPISRGFQVAELSQFRARRLDLAVPDSRFVTLKINGKNYGVYWEVEEKSKDFLEKEEQPSDVNLYNNAGSVDDLYQNVFGWEKKADNPADVMDNYGELDTLLDLLNNTSDEEFNQKLPLILDMDNFYRWQIHEKLFGGYHQIYRNNLSIFFDRTSGKFKLSPEDVSVEPTRFNLFSLLTPVGSESAQDIDYNPLVTRILKNPQFVYERNKVLWDYVSDSNNLSAEKKFYNDLYQIIRWPTYKETRNTYSHLYFDVYNSFVFKKIEGYFKANQELLKNTDPLYVKVDYAQKQVAIDLTVKNFSGVNLQNVKIALNEKQTSTGALCLYLDEDRNGGLGVNDKKLTCTQLKTGDKEVVLEPVNLPLLTARDVLRRTSVDSGLMGLSFDPIVIKPTTYKLLVVFTGDYAGNLIELLNKFEFGIVNAITGDKVKAEIVYTNKTTFDKLEDVFLNVDFFVANNPQFLKKSNKELLLPAGTHIFRDDVIVPQGVNLTIEAGATLKFAAKKSLVSYSPIQAVGKENLPIIFTAQSPGIVWGVVGILNTNDQESNFKYVIFDNGGDTYLNGVFLSGQLSVYHSKVNIANSTFTFAHGDDSVNIKNSNSKITASLFRKNLFDGLDMDFSSSEVVNCRFEENGNDGLDISAGQPYLFGNNIFSSKDKGISLGENTKAIVFNNLIRDCNVGIAIKDLSEPKIINSTIINNKTGVASYKKKDIFGGGNGTIINSIIWGNEKQLDLDSLSTVSLSYSVVEGGNIGEKIQDKNPKLNANYYSEDFSLEIDRKVMKDYCPDCSAMVMGIFKH